MSMIGYYKDPEGTRQAFTDDGFFKTGDLGELDSGGWLKITGRVKEQFKTSKGKYVSPARIEEALSVHPRIEGCCVMGAGMPHAFALAGINPDGGAPREELESSLLALLEDVNSRLEAHERLKFVVVTTEPWTIANGFLTPTMKLKRWVLEARYSRYFDQWAGHQRAVVWHE